MWSGDSSAFTENLLWEEQFSTSFNFLCGFTPNELYLSDGCVFEQELKRKFISDFNSVDYNMWQRNKERVRKNFHLIAIRDETTVGWMLVAGKTLCRDRFHARNLQNATDATAVGMGFS